jgi:hypothetical protein
MIDDKVERQHVLLILPRMRLPAQQELSPPGKCTLGFLLKRF